MHLKFQLSRKESRGLFGGSISKHLSDWLQSVLEGLDGGEPLLKLAVCGGLLSALNDIKSEVSVKVAGKLEEELVLSFSVVLGEASAQSINGDDDAWEREFLPRTEDAHSKRNILILLYYSLTFKTLEKLNAAVILASHYFVFVSDEILSALRLPVSKAHRLVIQGDLSVCRLS